jgi:hypothetical protein
MIPTRWLPHARPVRKGFPANVHARRREVREALKKPRQHSVMAVYVGCMRQWVLVRPTGSSSGV